MTRKWMRLRVSAEAIAELMMFKAEIIEQTLPKTAKFVYFDYDISSRCFHFIYEDESFDEIPEACLIPELELPTWRFKYDS